jgi:hypothetical protein
MKHLSLELNRKSLPFRFKVLNNPHHYPRADAAVLYVDKEYYEGARACILSVYSCLREVLDPSTPLFAKRLAPGLSLAEDPNNNESFGQHRCRILAESLKLISKKNIISTEESISEIESYFRNLKLDLYSPYLNPGSTDDYETNIPIIGDHT